MACPSIRGVVRSVSHAALVVALLGTGGLSRAQGDPPVYRLLHAFKDDGWQPRGELMRASDGNLYGTTFRGGTHGTFYEGGTLYRMNADHGVDVLHDFDPVHGDGDGPIGKLAEGPDHCLYGVTENGGAIYSGTVFRYCLGDGSYRLLHSFGDRGGPAYPPAGLILGQDGRFYGPAWGNDWGSIYSVGTDGDVRVVHEFRKHHDGAHPSAPLLQAADGTLYGSYERAGKSSHGGVFSIQPDGSGYRNLHNFWWPTGAYPSGALIQGSDGALYGTTQEGGKDTRYGTVFRLTLAGEYTVLHSFGRAEGDGRYPQSGVVQAADGALYGTTFFGGEGCGDRGCGTVFRVTTDGKETIVHAFPGRHLASMPGAGLTLVDGHTLVGTTTGWYSIPFGSSHGTVFGIDLPR